MGAIDLLRSEVHRLRKAEAETINTAPPLRAQLRKTTAEAILRVIDAADVCYGKANSGDEDEVRWETLEELELYEAVRSLREVT